MRARARAAAQRERRRSRWITLGVILAPVVIAAVYANFIAVPRYSADARFSVRSSSSPPAFPGAAGGLLTTGDSSGLAGGFVDGWAVSDFLNSRDCMQQVDRKIKLRQRLAHTGLDPAARLAPDATEDELYRAYKASVNVSYNMMEQVDVMKVSAFSPRDAAVISGALLEAAQEFVNRMDEKGVSDALKVSRQAVSLAENDARAARASLTRWRVQHGNMDPNADATMLLTLVGQIEGELNGAQINLDKIRAVGNPDHPMLRPAQTLVTTLEKRLADTRRRLSGAGNTEATQLREYEELRNAQTFADSALTAAQQSYQQAFTDTLRLQRYLSVIAKPLPGDRPSSPDTFVLLLEALAAGFVLALAVRFGCALGKEFRHG
ncbi:capsule polysaccharide export ABC transporter transmembrane protein [Caballeronia pedi]|uniref:Capsule polysaccharide export ABC transporter transmembrane protein n=1 Tax=Caballeronia pedi TaxID=1777141 RepID=A0A158D191_9BURK|nr:sugar ABC transporter [Caballeronia pedi]SAK87607.1 capsule polysaccharide export ABC transporter transmembrane protein [Caballeronia pedi]